MGQGYDRHTETEAASVDASASGGAGRNRRQDQVGNAAIASGLGAQVAGQAREQVAWRESGNLIGNPPVRSESPPNIGIVENEAEYRRRLGHVQARGADRKKTADGMLDAKGNVVDNRYWFTRVYQYVTENEISEARSKTFWYPSYVMECVRYFDKIYEDNLKAADSGGSVEEHWQRAFDVAADKHEMTLLSVAGEASDFGAPLIGGLLAGPLGFVAGLITGDMLEEMTHATESLVAHMQAHIRFDLPRAEAWVFSGLYKDMDGASISDFSADFMSMTSVFDRAAVKMGVDIGDRVGLPAELVPRMVQDMVMAYAGDADMATERADTWQRAEELVNNGLEGSNPYREAPGGGALQGDVTRNNTLGGMQQIPTTDLRPTMDSSAPLIDDNETRAKSYSELQSASTSERIRMLRGLLRGVTFNGDEDAALSILRISIREGDFVSVVDAASAWDICYALDGKQYDTVRMLLIHHYYRQTARSSAQTIIERCMNGETAEWEERMIADIIVGRSDRRDLVTAIGRNRGGGANAYQVGRDAVYWNVDWSEQSDVERVLE
jgi:hypothetical protein